LRDFNEPHELVSPKDIPNYMPDQRHRATRALYIHNEGWFNPRLMVEKLDAILARDHRIAFVEAHVAKLEQTNGTIASVLLEDGQRIE
ncbi:UNVERIFIED_CONTAM: FAD-binding oxidoreductase, partial [Bacteroidetes bacterium 56_B9]